VEGEPPPEEESIPSLVTRLIDDGEQYVRSELRLYRARLFSRVDEARTAIVLGFGALVLAQAVLVTALVGILLTLRKYVGPAVATVILVVVGLAVTALMAALAYRLLKKATEIKPRDERP
jgi:hypothetical protein